MAIRKIRRESIIKPKVPIKPIDYKQEIESDNVLIRKQDNSPKEIFVNKQQGKHSVSDDLTICYDTNTIIFEDGKTANLLKLGIPERNIDTGKIILPITTTYMEQTIELRVPKEKVSSKRDIIKLSAEGASVNEINAKYHIKSIEYQESQMKMIRNRHSELGCCQYQGKEAFKLYNGVNIDSLYDGTLDIKPKGNIDDYLKDIINIVAPYRNISLAFALGASSSIVARLSRANIGITNLLVHIVNGSSKGKSTATMLAISVWGNPKLTSGGLYNTWNRTENALLTSLAGNYGLTYALDELSMATVNDLSKTIYKIAEGKDKDRLTKEIELRKSGTWNTTIISNGEASILGKCSKNEGIDVRVLELSDIVWAENAEHSDLVKELANKNYGVFGYSFVEKLIQIPIEELKYRFENEKEEFIKKVKEKGIIDSKLQRTAAKNAIVILTAKLINEWYYSKGLNLDVNSISELLVDNEIVSIQRRGMDRKAEEWLLQQIEINASKFRKGRTVGNLNTDYWGSIEDISDGEIEVSILKSKFRDIMKQGNFEDANIVIKKFKEEGKLYHDKDRDTRKRKINKVKTPVYVIRLKL